MIVALDLDLDDGLMRRLNEQCLHAHPPIRRVGEECGAGVIRHDRSPDIDRAAGNRDEHGPIRWRLDCQLLGVGIGDCDPGR
ncbi:MAG: hypothetical protein WD647_13245 [Steroidobacteraceae bacterium]